MNKIAQSHAEIRLTNGKRYKDTDSIASSYIHFMRRFTFLCTLLSESDVTHESSFPRRPERKLSCSSLNKIQTVSFHINDDYP